MQKDNILTNELRDQFLKEFIPILTVDILPFILDKYLPVYIKDSDFSKDPSKALLYLIDYLHNTKDINLRFLSIILNEIRAIYNKLKHNKEIDIRTIKRILNCLGDLNLLIDNDKIKSSYNYITLFCIKNKLLIKEIDDGNKNISFQSKEELIPNYPLIEGYPQGETMDFYKKNGYHNFIKGRTVVFLRGPYAGRKCNVIKINNNNVQCFFIDDSSTHHISTTNNFYYLN